MFTQDFYDAGSREQRIGWFFGKVHMKKLIAGIVIALIVAFVFASWYSFFMDTNVKTKYETREMKQMAFERDNLKFYGR